MEISVHDFLTAAILTAKQSQKLNKSTEHTVLECLLLRMYSSVRSSVLTIALLQNLKRSMKVLFVCAALRFVAADTFHSHLTKNI